MDTNMKTICFDEDLQIEAYQFIGVKQKFPNHFHEYYVIGLIEVGERRVTVNNQNYTIGPGDLMTFNPMDNHACIQLDSGGLSYRCINIGREVIEALVVEILGSDGLPHFRAPIQYRTELAAAFLELHNGIMNRIPGLEKEELFLLFMEQLLTAHAELPARHLPQAVPKEIVAVCDFVENHYTEHITLDQLSQIANLNKYTLIRTFTRLKGITPYRYLANIRIGAARKLLEQPSWG